MNYYLSVLNKYATFSGRARRTEYWYFYLFDMIITLGLLFGDVAIGTYDYESGIGLFFSLYTLFTALPRFAVLVRRLHDIGYSGWMILVSLIPLIGGFWLFILMLMDSNPGENKYGPNPKESNPRYIT